VHIFSASYWAFVLVPTPAVFAARLHGAKTIIHYHSGEARDHLKRWRSARSTLRAANSVVVPSRYLAEIFERFAIPTTTISNGIDSENFHFRLRKPLRPRLICTRAFERYYRVDLVIRAFEIVKKRFPAASLTLVGSGSLETSLRALVSQLGLTSSITFAGAVGNQEIHRFYDENDIFINASEVDNLPVSILEAFASGTVVASTSPGGIPFLVEHSRTGLLSPPGSTQELAQNVIDIVDDPEFAEAMAMAAYEEFKRRTWPFLRKQWIENYLKLAGDPRRIQINNEDTRTIGSQTHAG
jgi:glycosyltransferase involved in cell wall biosynthesis